MSIFLLGLVLFVAIHCVRIAAPAFREAQIERFGDGGWKGIYTVLSLLGFAALIYGWSSARQESGLLYIPIDGLKIVNYLGMLIAFVLLVASQIPAGHIKAKTKHPMMIAVLVWSVGHLLSNGDTASVLLFGVFLVWSIFGLRSMFGRSSGECTQPAILFDIISVAVGLGLYLATFTFAHLYLFGVSPA